MSARSVLAALSAAAVGALFWAGAAVAGESIPPGGEADTRLVLRVGEPTPIGGPSFAPTAPVTASPTGSQSPSPSPTRTRPQSPSSSSSEAAPTASPAGGGRDGWLPRTGTGAACAALVGAFAVAAGALLRRAVRARAGRSGGLD